MTKPKIIFLGTPEFSAVILEELIKSDNYEISAVVTGADKPVGRGQVLSPSPVKVIAGKYGIPVFTPKTLKNVTILVHEDRKFLHANTSETNELTALLERLNTESNTAQPVLLAVLVAYGKIIPAALLNLPKFGFVNVHTSLLPRWRGAAPMQHALFAGDTKTGISIMQMDEGLDTGGVYKTEEITIGENYNLQDLHDRLLSVSGRLLQETLPLILESKITATAQPTEGITYAHKWEKNDLNINWDEPAEVTLRRIRTCSPTPGAKTVFDGQLMKIFAAHLVDDSTFKILPAGTIVELNKNELIVCTGDSNNGKFIAIDKIQLPGKSIIDIKSALNGRHFEAGERFEELKIKSG